MKLEANDTILFIGDSITDAGRDRNDSHHLGYGYPLMIAGRLLAIYPELNLKVVNRGISGDRVSHLQERWLNDCLRTQPDVVSILIGINDTWHNMGTDVSGSSESMIQFKSKYQDILTQVKEKTKAKIVIVEPFLLPYPADRREWRYDLDQRIQIIRELANEYADEFVSLDGVFHSTGIKSSYQYLTGEDGVHPTVAGHGKIAEEWLKIIEN
ncbi:SGNH/GDSL hydrolase family protein [Carnobacterium sp. FSL W8-0810]|uniref:SGNH/GDSL hydrolase family protein n=1 Tax=Carnobacterium sp. FSL W8-0810 TaxID=2954705 RepID=UPI0030FA2404